MASKLRADVLRSFKALHKARKLIFEGDKHALEVARTQINEGYRKNMNVKDETAILEMIKFSNEVEHELKTTLVQARQVEPGKYELKILDETVKLDNVPFQDVPEEVLLANKRKASSKCSKNKEKA